MEELEIEPLTSEEQEYSKYDTFYLIIPKSKLGELLYGSLITYQEYIDRSPNVIPRELNDTHVGIRCSLRGVDVPKAVQALVNTGCCDCMEEVDTVEEIDLETIHENDILFPCKREYIIILQNLKVEEVV